MAAKPTTGRQSHQPSTEDRKDEHSVVNPGREEEIKRRAFEIYLQRGEEPGRDLEDWLQAERELASHETTP
jgi:hypothetical protein